MSSRTDRLHTLAHHSARLERRLVELDRRDRAFFWFRLGTLATGLAAVAIAFFAAQPAWVWALLVLVAGIFAVVVYLHRRLDHTRLRFHLAQQLTRSQVARSSLDWAGIPYPSTGEEFQSAPDDPAEQHPFQIDLHLTGPRSLHHLIDTALSKGGSRRLADWLLQPVPDPEVIRFRQEILQELRSRSGFRRNLALRGALVTRTEERWDGEALLDWLARTSENGSLRPLLIGLGLLAVVNLLLFAFFMTGLLPAFWIITIVIYGGIYAYAHGKISDIFGDAQHISLSLNKFRAVMEYLETYVCPGCPHLAGLLKPFHRAKERPSRYLSRASWLTSAASLQHNEFLWLLVNILIPWDFYIAYRLEIFKRQLGQRLPRWLDHWYELEALNSLANFAYLNPEYHFPQIEPVASEPVFKAEALGHPLLRHDEKVCNDFTIDRLGQVTIVTGSNMSGKSTFLRTIGVNIALAFAGGPVNAESLQTLPFRLFTCIQVSDSLNDGISYFYAEVRRLRALLDALQAPAEFPLFFLIDEIFRGTNNLEREIGSRSFVRALIGAHGTGVISTHDLELVHLAEDFESVRNFHFREHVEGDRLAFDYLLHHGPSPTTNALKIMRMEGLPVEQP